MHRTPAEIQADITRVQGSLAALPDSAIRMGLDEDYLGQLDALQEELAAAQAAEEENQQ